MFSDHLLVLSLQITLVVMCVLYYRPYIGGISTDTNITLEPKYRPIL